MTELPIQISRLLLSLLTPRKPSVQCCLVFRNFYVAWLRIVQINVDGSSTELASTYPLMKHVHYEDDAQNWQIVKLNQLPVSWNPHIFDSLYVYLSQPSPLWKTWELHDVKFYELPQDAAEARLTQLLKRQFSRPTLAHGHTGVNSGTNSVEERATRCLDLVLRLRELLEPIEE
ncbi:uncharacterized protein PITG_16000 [Phytophthora infestans T30-4]|uniref:Uncharacterized protein n=1 Tax=Phytophthora infestans (strain T30-4) TaxID=403677 RepID=D0NSM1_PHYIT|nr:uncharacterized protein PITG_16000 [Phytophthora infestans T30-4]EEY64583.1 conserved hypothetical protein [Phytophthora infestans T30-4]|eukprot:XP_002897783.1 conserved hypothetical protein [Phytophthora infestans T30-4]